MVQQRCDKCKEEERKAENQDEPNPHQCKYWTRRAHQGKTGGQAHKNDSHPGQHLPVDISECERAAHREGVSAIHEKNTR